MGEINVQGWQLFEVVFGVMVAMGLLGGFINFQMKAKDDPDLTRWKSLSFGVGAAVLVPLFLNTISSNILSSSSKMTYSNLLIFAGFCLIAGYSSRAFMKTLAERLLQEAKQVNKVAKEQAEKVEDLVSEPDTPTTASTTTAETQEITDLERRAPDRNALKVLRALQDTRFVIRTFSGISMDTGLKNNEVDGCLRELEKLGLAQILQRPKGTRATITAQGREFLRKLSVSDPRWESTK